MKLTKFEKLLRSVRSLGANEVVDKLAKILWSGKADANPENLVYGEHGIYLVEKGIATKVILHIVDKNISTHYFPEEARDAVIKSNFDDPFLIEKSHKFHLVNCQTLQRAKRQGWRDRYKMSHKQDGTFFYRFISSSEIIAERENQELLICGNCLREINQNEVVENIFNRNNFDLGVFFSNGFQKHWIPDGGCKSDTSSTPNMYQKDWKLISQKYRELVKFQCEGDDCQFPNLSDVRLQKFLHCHHVDFDKSHSNFSNLKALCIKCHALQPNHAHLEHNPDYKVFIRYRH